MDLAHSCIDCRLDESMAGRVPRPAPYGGPRSRRCATHERARKRAVKARAKVTRTQRIFNLTEEESDAIWEAQGRRCAICLRPVVVRAAANDHDHRCCPGETSCGNCIRGKLCKPCNSMLAHGRDDYQMFLRAARYLLLPPAVAVLKKLRERP